MVQPIVTVSVTKWLLYSSRATASHNNRKKPSESSLAPSSPSTRRMAATRSRNRAILDSLAAACFCLASQCCNSGGNFQQIFIVLLQGFGIGGCSNRFDIGLNTSAFTLVACYLFGDSEQFFGVLLFEFLHMVIKQARSGRSPSTDHSSVPEKSYQSPQRSLIMYLTLGCGLGGALLFCSSHQSR